MLAARDEWRRSGCHILVNPLDLRNQRAGRVAQRSLASGPSHSGASFRLGEQFYDACPQGRYVTWWHQDAGRAIHYQVGEAAYGRRDQRPTGCHCLKRDERTWLRPT